MMPARLLQTGNQAPFPAPQPEETMANTWAPDSWQGFEARHLPSYPDAGALDAATASLATHPPLVFAGEARILIHVGPYSPPTAPLLLSAGVDVVGWPRLEALRVEESFGGLVSTWSFDGASSAWLVKDFDPTSAATSWPHCRPRRRW